MSPSAARAVLVRRRYLFAVLLSVAATMMQVRLRAVAHESIPLVALPAIVAAAWYGGIGPGALTAVATLTTAAWLAGAADATARAGPAGVVNFVIVAMTALVLGLTTLQLRRTARDERRRRLESDRMCREKIVLEAVARAVSTARTCAEVTAACATELMRATRAAAATVARVSADGEVEVVQAFGYDEPVSARCSLSSTNRLAVSIRQGRVVSGVRSDVGAPANGVDAMLARHEAFMIVPLAASTGPLGAVTLGFDRAAAVENGERDCLLEAGQCVAQALERARLYDSAERARKEGEAFRVRADAELLERRRAEEAHRESEARYRTLAARTQRLYSLSAALSEASTLDAVARAVVRHGRSVLGAAAGSVALCEGDAFDTLYAEEYPPAVVEAKGRFTAEPGMCTTAAIATRRAVLVGSFADLQAQYPRSAATAADGGFASAASLPLLVDNTAIGVLSFHFTVPVNFDPDYQALLTSVAQHAAQALDRARLYETSQRARVDAEAANHAKDDFLSIVSHELRTPLNAILGWGAMLRYGTLDPARVERATEAIVKNASRQARLVDDLLDVSRIVAGRVTLDLQDLELADVLRGAVDAMLPVATERGVELEIGHLPAVRVKADPHRLEQAFSNLLTNALKFTPSGGRVTVDGTVDKGTVRVRVTDTGCGIEADVLPHIFERFRQGNNTTTRSVGGLGLGLFIVRRLIEALQGQVVAESAGKDAGATFTVSLPVAAASSLPLSSSPAVRSEREASGAAAPDLSSIRVLVIDDEPDTREMMSSALGLYGAAVTTVSSARDAMVKLEDAPYDVVLSDLAMPDEDGYELIRRIRAHPNAGVARVPAAAVTACARDDERQRALAAGFDVHLAKPLAPGALAETVTRLAGAAAADA